jgi:hypothetical protein
MKLIYLLEGSTSYCKHIKFVVVVGLQDCSLWSRVLLDKQMVFQLAMKFSDSYEDPLHFPKKNLKLYYHY